MSVSESKLSQISEDPAPIYFDQYARLIRLPGYVFALSNLTAI